MFWIRERHSWYKRQTDRQNAYNVESVYACQGGGGQGVPVFPPPPPPLEKTGKTGENVTFFLNIFGHFDNLGDEYDPKYKRFFTEKVENIPKIGYL